LQIPDPVLVESSEADENGQIKRRKTAGSNSYHGRATGTARNPCGRLMLHRKTPFLAATGATKVAR